jgi:hypothetical protein
MERRRCALRASVETSLWGFSEEEAAFEEEVDFPYLISPFPFVLAGFVRLGRQAPARQHYSGNDK